MIIDSSAILAVLKSEPEAPAYLRALENVSVRRLSAATLFEASVVVDGSRNSFVILEYERFLATYSVIIEPVTEIQAKIARQAYREFGRGSGSSAQLNFGDCFSYALAKDKNEPLLYKGNDFVHTDVRSAMGER